MEWYHYILIVGIGMVVGFINVLAGGGSALSLAILIFLGLPASVANGTNRIAILLATLVGASNFRHKKIFSVKKSLWLIFPSIAGAIIGAWFAIDINDAALEKFIGGFLVLIFLIYLFKPDVLLKNSAKVFTQRNKWFVGLIFFFIGIYGGFIQIGAGIFFLALLSLVAGYDIIKANALKLFIILGYTPFVLVIFMEHEQVNFLYGLLMGLGTGLGAFIASNLAIRKGVKFLRYFLLVVLLVFILKFFGVIDMLFLFRSS